MIDTYRRLNKKLLTAALFCAFFSAVSAKLVRHNLVVARGTSWVDCYEEKDMFLINGKIPGPAIYAELGDDLELTVKNNLEDAAFSMHWHGILHPKSPWNDGTPGVTEYSILPGQQRTYRFKAEKPGTYFYHSHTRLHAVTVHGALIITAPNDRNMLKYDRDENIILTEYFHQDIDQILDEHEHVRSGHSVPDVGDSILVNGYTPSPLAMTRACEEKKEGKACDTKRCGRYVLNVKKGENIRLRIINSGVKSNFRIKIARHDAKIVEVDGDLVAPTQRLADSDLHIGQRYSVLLKANQPPGVYEATIGIEGHPQLTTSFLIAYSGAKNLNPISDKTPFQPINEELQVWRPFGFSTYPRRADRVIVLNVTFGQGHFSVNDKVWVPPTLDHHLLEMSYRNRTAVTSQDNVYSLRVGEVVDLVVQLGNFCSTHPWHMHGHIFWDMGGGSGAYDAASFKPLRNPLKKDTVTLRPGPVNGTEVCGYRVLRLKVKNPGVWHMHCHIHDHMVRGMQLVLAASLDQLMPLPAEDRDIVLRPPQLSKAVSNMEVLYY